jgi:hypothetical protein
MKTTITLNEEDAQIFRLLKARTGYTLDEIFSMLAKEVKVIMCEGIDPKASRLNFMIDADLKNSMVHLRFSPLYFGLGNLTLEQQKEVKKAFGYGENFEDLREKPTEEKDEKQ